MGSLTNPVHHFSSNKNEVGFFDKKCFVSYFFRNIDNHLTKVTVSGKLAQAYAGGATVIADKKETGSQIGNCEWDV